MVDPCWYGSAILKNPNNVLTIFFQILEKLKIPKYRPRSEIPADLLSIYSRKDFPQHSAIKNYESKYLPFEDRICILDEKYTMRSAIHELLHSFSVYAKNFDAFRKRFYLKRNMSEGHTEFLTGLILYLYFPTCYEIWQDVYWKYDLDDFKRVIGHDSDPNWTKIWFSIAYHYDLRQVIDSYFLYTTNTIDDLCTRFKTANIQFIIDLEDKDLIDLKLGELFEDHVENFEKLDHLDYRWLDDSIIRANIDKAPLKFSGTTLK